MKKKETFKWIVQIIASVATAILTALGATSCMGIWPKESIVVWANWSEGPVKVPRFALYVAKKKRVTICDPDIAQFKINLVYLER